MLGRFSSLIEPRFSGISKALHNFGLRPNHVTLASFVLSMLVAATFAFLANLAWGTMLAGVLLLLAGFFDAVDGSMARLYREESRFGAFLDSLLDRISETVVYMGLIYSGLITWWLGFASLSTALFVSYARARAESLKSHMKGEGFAERPERILLLAGSSILNQLPLGVAIIAVLSGITLLQRVRYAFLTMRTTDAKIA